MALTEDQIEQLRVKHGGKVAVVDMHGHQLVFKRPSRETVRDYRRKQDSPVERPDALDQLGQVTIVSFDGDTGGESTRLSFLQFLNEFPAFTSTARFVIAMNVLTGMVETEEGEELGKGVRVKNARPKLTPEALPNGSGTAQGPLTS
jgi:hypothetical protein